ncbi:hypothetical protein BCV71DRAFT_183394 [Rhizopus microsporus]|uniref:Uncharacterized protein n=1 Tax=Rhizopus microsporus TaxID=58291 RepID=A0A1X0RX12_RHIZD|nr:hypothetical protein BCV71DRAFT_183394 [Rhizopus microsporus]
MPEAISDPLSFLLICYLGKNHAPFKPDLPWTLRWPAICVLAHELDNLYHQKNPLSPPSRLGQRLPLFPR